METANDLCYLCDGTYDGLLTCVFIAYESKKLPCEILDEKLYQQELERKYKLIITDYQKSERVFEGIIKKIGSEAAQNCYRAMLTDNEKKLTYIFHYICLGFRIGSSINNHLTNSYVSQVIGLSRFVGREAHLSLEFLRFTELKDKIFYAAISPDANVVEIVANHFISRFPDQSFVIHDKKRHIAAIYNKKDLFIGNAPDKIAADADINEDKYRLLWKTFFDTIAVKERINPKLQRSNMPKKFWKHMTEFIQ